MFIALAIAVVAWSLLCWVDFVREVRREVALTKAVLERTAR
jgi:hypothetical protein